GAVPPPRNEPWGAPIVPLRPPATPEPVVPAWEAPVSFVPTPRAADPGYTASQPGGQISPASPPYAPFLPASPAGPPPRPRGRWTSLSEIPEEEESLSPWAAAAAGVIATPPAPPSILAPTPPPPPRTGLPIRRQPSPPPPTSTAGRIHLPQRRVIYGIVVGALALGVVLFLLLGTSATVTITVAETPLKVTPTIQGTTSTAQAGQANYILSKQITDTASQTFQATPTGSQPVPAVAATSVVVLSATGQGPCADGCTFTLEPTYQFETATTPSVVFGVSGQTGVTVPAGGGPSSAIPVTALTTGTIGNVPAGAITLCPSTSAGGDWCTSLDLKATNTAAATGGVDGGSQTVASASDIANWQEQLGQMEEQLGNKAGSDLSAKAGQEKVAVDPNGGGRSITYTVSPSTFPPATANTVMTAETVTVTMTAQETVYNPADLNAVVLKDLQASSNLPAGDSLVPSQLQLNNVQIIQAGG